MNWLKIDIETLFFTKMVQFSILKPKLEQFDGTYFSLIHDLYNTQYGHSQSEKKWGLCDKYHHSIKVHT